MNFEIAKKHFLDGLTHLNNSNFAKAEFHFLESLALIPDRVSTLTNLSATQVKLKKYYEARANLQKVISLEKNNSEAYLNLGLIDREEDNLISALEFFNLSLKFNPNYPEALSNRGAILSELKHFDEALAAYDKAILLKPDYHEAWSNRGATLNELKLYDEALAAYDKAILLKPDYHEAWSDKGVILHELKRYDEALAAYDKAIQLKPEYYDAYWNKASTQLVTGDFEGGWKNYEYRWKKTKPDLMRHQQLPSLTNLNKISEKTILVWSEQGYGDTIQFSRLIEKIIDLNAKVIFEVQEPLKELFKKSFTQTKIISQGEPMGNIDFQIPLLSLPLLFSTNMENIPRTHSYIKVSEDNLLYWKNKLALNNRKINIGIACSGNIKHLNDKNRSMDLRFFEPIAKQANLFLIQRDVKPIDRDFLNQFPDIKFLGSEIKNFNDSASIIHAMDVVITVDTSLAHLSGALGKPTLILLPWSSEWRWLLDRQDSPWYPSAKIFRQPNKDNWEALIKDVAIHLNLNYQS